jgi:glutathione peroxidase
MYKYILLTILLLSGQAYAAECSPLLNRTLTTLQGDPINLCQYTGKPILVVNTASKCGFAPQFDKLEGMYSKYEKQGFVVIGFPSNDFHQELSDKKEIAKFCKLTYNVKFPMMEPSSVKGTAANDFYKELIKATGAAPTWNFHKYLIAPDGTTIYSFNTPIEPDSPEILGKIETMLEAVTKN